MGHSPDCWEAAGEFSLLQKGSWESLRGPKQGRDSFLSLKESKGRRDSQPQSGVCGHQALGRDWSGFPFSSEILLLALPVGPVFPRPRGNIS